MAMSLVAVFVASHLIPFLPPGITYLACCRLVSSGWVVACMGHPVYQIASSKQSASVDAVASQILVARCQSLTSSWPLGDSATHRIPNPAWPKCKRLVSWRAPSGLMTILACGFVGTQRQAFEAEC